MSTPQPIVEVLRDYHRLFLLRNLAHGALEPDLDAEWKQLSFTVQCLFSGMYLDGFEPVRANAALKPQSELPVDSLRVPFEARAMCESELVFFGGTLRDLSTGGAYLEAMFPFTVGEDVHLSLNLFPNETTEVDCRVAWANTRGRVKPSLEEGAGLEFIHASETIRRQIRDCVQSVVEHTLTQAALI